MEEHDRAGIQGSDSSEESLNPGSLQDDLQRMKGWWMREKSQESPYEPMFSFSKGAMEGVHRLSIQARDFGGADKPYPLFPFFDFELREKDGKRFIAPNKDSEAIAQDFGISEIPYRLERNLLIIEEGRLIVQHGFGKEEVELRGEYR